MAALRSQPPLDDGSRSFGTQLSGQTIKTIGEHRQAFAPGEISLTDFPSPFQWRSAGASAGDLATSPLYELFQTHVLQLYRFLEEDIPASAVESLGSATLELARAVIATVGQDDLARGTRPKPQRGQRRPGRLLARRRTAAGTPTASR